MMHQVTITISVEQEEALTAELSEINARLTVQNEALLAEQERAISEGRPMPQVTLQPMLTLDELIQRRVHERMEVDVQRRIVGVAQNLAAMFVKADPATRAAMQQDIAKWQQAAQNPQNPQQ
jgi:hypothetical protein